MTHSIGSIVGSIAQKSICGEGYIALALHSRLLQHVMYANMNGSINTKGERLEGTLSELDPYARGHSRERCIAFTPATSCVKCMEAFKTSGWKRSNKLVPSQITKQHAGQTKPRARCKSIIKRRKGHAPNTVSGGVYREGKFRSGNIQRADQKRCAWHTSVVQGHAPNTVTGATDRASPAMLAYVPTRCKGKHRYSWQWAEAFWDKACDSDARLANMFTGLLNVHTNRIIGQITKRAYTGIARNKTELLAASVRSYEARQHNLRSPKAPCA